MWRQWYLSLFNCILKAKARRDPCHTTAAAKLPSDGTFPSDGKGVWLEGSAPWIILVRANAPPSTLPGVHNTHNWGTLMRCMELNVNPPAPTPFPSGTWLVASVWQQEKLSSRLGVLWSSSALSELFSIQKDASTDKLILLLKDCESGWILFIFSFAFYWRLHSWQPGAHERGKHGWTELRSEWWDRLWLHHAVHRSKATQLTSLVNSVCVRTNGFCAPHTFLSLSLEEDVAKKPLVRTVCERVCTSATVWVTG